MRGISLSHGFASQMSPPSSAFWRVSFSLGWSLLLLLLWVAPSSTCAAPGDRVFDELQIHEIRFEFDQVDWYQDLEQSWEDKEYIHAAVLVNGLSYDSVGVRFKGLTSYRRYPTDKKPFRIKFDKFKDHDWDGLRKVSLNNGWSDPTLIKEKLHLDFLRRHRSDGPRGNFARVYVNDTYWGFYSLVEHVDKIFLEDRIGNNGGNLYKADSAARLRWEGPEQQRYYDNYVLKTNEDENDWSDLVNLVDKLFSVPQPELRDSLETIFNSSSHILAWSVNNVTHNWDSYLSNGRNYYLYSNSSTGLFDWISSDVSLTLGGFGRGPHLSLYETPSIHPLHVRMLQEPKYRSEYVTNVGRLVRHDFQSALWDPRIDELAAFIREDYLADPRRQYNDGEFTQGILDLKDWIRIRVEDIERQIDIELMDKIVINEVMYDPNPTSEGEVVEYVELYNSLPADQDIGDWSFNDGVSHTFPPETVLPVDDYAVVTNNRTAFIELYGELTLLFEWDSGRLSNDGERVAITDRTGLVIDEITYDDGGQWPIDATRSGSLELIHPSFDNDSGVSWLVSNPVLAPIGTPGEQNSAFAPDGASSPTIWSEPETLAYVGLEYGYLVEAADADRDTLTFSLAEAPGFLTIDPRTGQASGTPSAANMGSHPVEIQVSDGRGGTDRQSYDLEVIEPDPTYGIVINELHYNPAGADSTEFIELVNTESFDVDVSGWVFDDGIEFTFPPGSIAPADGFVVVAYDSSAMMAVYGASGVYEWTSGRLANSGEIVALSNATRIRVDSVPYLDRAPWPESPDGGGPSLELLATEPDNALPSSWQASEGQGTPGEKNGGAPIDDRDTLVGARIRSLRPNPFLEQIDIHYQLAEAGPVRIAVFDVTGRHVRTLVQEAVLPGTHEVRWYGLDERAHPARPGVYFLRVSGGGTVDSRQLVLLR